MESTQYPQFNDYPEVVRALKALPPSERYVPLYEAVQIFLSTRINPLDQALIALIEVPEDTHGALEQIARDFNVNRRTVCRHADSLRCKLARLYAERLIHHLQIHCLVNHVQNIQKILKGLN